MTPHTPTYASPHGRPVRRASRPPPRRRLSTPSHPRKPTCSTASNAPPRLASLRASLSLFREASTAYSDDATPQAAANSAPRPEPRALSLCGRHTGPPRPPCCSLRCCPSRRCANIRLSPTPTVVTPAADRPAQSDEALLDDIDRELSASVPTPMQALADPTASTRDIRPDFNPKERLTNDSRLAPLCSPLLRLLFPAPSRLLRQPTPPAPPSDPAPAARSGPARIEACVRQWERVRDMRGGPGRMHRDNARPCGFGGGLGGGLRGPVACGGRAPPSSSSSLSPPTRPRRWTTSSSRAASNSST